MSPHVNGSRRPVLTTSTINPTVLKVQYAVRGELALKADKYSQQLASPLAPGSSGYESPTPKLPFDKVVTANIGNPQQKGLDQQPITYWRQVISLLEYPDLFTKHLDVAKQIYPEDVVERAKTLHEEIGSTGAYTHSKGVLGIRKRVAQFIEGESGSGRATSGDCTAWEDGHLGAQGGEQRQNGLDLGWRRDKDAGAGVPQDGR
jgi:alanine transaminase